MHHALDNAQLVFKPPVTFSRHLVAVKPVPESVCLTAEFPLPMQEQEKMRAIKKKQLFTVMHQCKLMGMATC